MQRFLEEGFTEVTVESIAAESGMAASTVFRHFGTKEQLVLWDEHEIELERCLAKRLGRQPPLLALRDAFNETLAERYSADLDFQLQRIQYIYATTELHSAAVEADYRARTELTDALKSTLSKPHRKNAALVAGAALLALDIAVGRWQDCDAAKPLSKCINDAFRDLLRLESIV
jgi:AcrR family transcriptional regulator